MVALTKDRSTKQRIGDERIGAIAATGLIFAGALLMRNAAGFVLPGATATGMVGIGRAEEQIDNSAGADGDARVRVMGGIYRYANSAAADEIASANIGDLAYIVDDQTVALTNGTGTRSAAGTIHDVDTLGVWVRFDEALTRAATA